MDGERPLFCTPDDQCNDAKQPVQLPDALNARYKLMIQKNLIDVVSLLRATEVYVTNQ